MNRRCAPSSELPVRAGRCYHAACPTADNYFARFPATVVNANMPRTLSGNQPVLKRAGPSPSGVAPGNHVFALPGREFKVPVRMESNDLLFHGAWRRPVLCGGRWCPGSAATS